MRVYNISVCCMLLCLQRYIFTIEIAAVFSDISCLYSYSCHMLILMNDCCSLFLCLVFFYYLRVELSEGLKPLSDFFEKHENL